MGNLKTAFVITKNSHNKNCASYFSDCISRGKWWVFGGRCGAHFSLEWPQTGPQETYVECMESRKTGLNWISPFLEAALPVSQAGNGTSTSMGSRSTNLTTWCALLPSPHVCCCQSHPAHPLCSSAHWVWHFALSLSLR